MAQDKISCTTAFDAVLLRDGMVKVNNTHYTSKDKPTHLFSFWHKVKKHKVVKRKWWRFWEKKENVVKYMAWERGIAYLYESQANLIQNNEEIQRLVMQAMIGDLQGKSNVYNVQLEILPGASPYVKTTS